jgi:phosphoglycolate phosphatase-like HAD superfamily hydrolase
LTQSRDEVRPNTDVSAAVLAEAWQIAKAIRPRFAEYMTQYDTKKHWPVVYERVRREFRQPERMAPGTLRDALLWKYGHLGKPAIPPAHELLISQLQRGWPAVVTALLVL